MQITKLVRTKQDPLRIAVWIDDQYAFACHLELIIKAGWKKGVEITQQQIDAVHQADQRQKIRSHVFDLLARRPYSLQELRQRLLRPHPKKEPPSPDVVDEVLQQMREEGHINDEAFAEFWVEQRDTFRPRSSHILHAELRRKGIADETIDEVVHAGDDEARALSVARRMAERLFWQPEMNKRLFREKLGIFLVRRGFSYGLSQATAEALWQELLQEPGE